MARPPAAVADGRVLVLGGLGGLGSIVARWLVDSCGVQELTLLSRTGRTCKALPAGQHLLMVSHGTDIPHLMQENTTSAVIFNCLKVVTETPVWSLQKQRRFACGVGLAHSAALVTTAKCDAASAADAVQLGPQLGSRNLSGVIHAGGVLKDAVLQHVTSGVLREVPARSKPTIISRVSHGTEAPCADCYQSEILAASCPGQGCHPYTNDLRPAKLRLCRD